jgi:cold shock CspA family protein
VKEAEVIQLNTEKRIRGKIVKLNEENGWGFIVSPQKKFTRIYFHWSALSPTLSFTELGLGDVVEFDLVDYVDPKTEERKGWRAYKIEKI